MNKVVVVTGASSGIGLAIAQNFVEKGYCVYSFSRTEPKDEQIKFIPCDVSKRESVDKAFSQLIEKEGVLDILVNNAGMGISGAMEFEPQADIEKIIDVNFLGVVNCCSSALPYLRESKGLIMNVSSLAAEFATPFQAMYSATKMAIIAFSNALKNEVRPFGVRITCALPGSVKTGFTDSRIKNDKVETPYTKRENRSVEYMEKCEIEGVSPQKIAKVICKKAERKNPPLSFAIGFPYKIARLAYRIFPQKFVSFVLYQIYGK